MRAKIPFLFLFGFSQPHSIDIPNSHSHTHPYIYVCIISSATLEKADDGRESTHRSWKETSLRNIIPSNILILKLALSFHFLCPRGWEKTYHVSFFLSFLLSFRGMQRKVESSSCIFGFASRENEQVLFFFVLKWRKNSSRGNLGKNKKEPRNVLFFKL